MATAGGVVLLTVADPKSDPLLTAPVVLRKREREWLSAARVTRLSSASRWRFPACVMMTVPLSNVSPSSRNGFIAKRARTSWRMIRSEERRGGKGGRAGQGPDERKTGMGGG